MDHKWVDWLHNPCRLGGPQHLKAEHKIPHHPPTCGPSLISSPARHCWGPLRRQGLFTVSPQLWAISDFISRSDALATRNSVGILYAICPLVCRGYVAILPTSGPLLILSLAVKRWGPSRRSWLCSQSTNSRPLLISSPALKCWVSPPPPPARQLPTFGPVLILFPSLKRWAPLEGWGYAANPPTFGPLLNFFPALKRSVPRRRKGLCSQSTHVWTTFDFVPCSEVFGTRHTARVM